MSFTLEIHFHCLFCYVRDPDEPKVHLLAPSTQGHHDHGGGVVRHVVRVVRVRPGASAGIPYTHEIIRVDDEEDWAEGFAVSLPEGGGIAPPPAALDDLILDYTHHSNGRRVRKHHITGSPGNQVASRFTLLGGDIASCVVDTFWELEAEEGTREIDLTREVIWTIEDIPGSQLRWSRRRLNGNHAPQQLTPLEAEGGFMRLEVFHVQEGDFPPPFKRRPPDDNAGHVHAFSDLFDGDPAAPLVPRVRPDRPRSFTVGCASVQGRVAP